ncbi:glycosyltransferase family 4 protein [Myroides odoratimimus]|uniref:glycosyltransferase n=1 Tax=Myroides odoratimimus TaxID=76832 RepID=UPI0025757685|nr:glycosyltransferase [Myroides odoratimimus]MDM1457281.1 glycosyltransferase family 4 protein [Myroides odoratimimus]
MKAKEKIVLVTGLYPLFKGGAEYQMRLIADRLKKEYEIVFLYLGDVPGQRVEETTSQIVDGYKVYFIKSCTKLDTLTLKYTYGRRIYEVLQKEKPAFVYQRVLKFMSYYISKYQNELGYKHFIHVADLFTLQFNRDTLRGKFNYHFFQKTVENKSRFIVQTGEQREALATLGVTPVLQVYNMHPTLDNAVLQYIEKKVKSEVAHIVWVANIKPIKQLELFVELAEKYSGNPKVHFDIIGSIQDAMYANPIIERMKGLSNITHYQGKDNEFVNEFLLKEGSLVVNTSVSEGFSNVFIQSWLRGIPVLSLNSDPDKVFDKHPELGSCVFGDGDALEAKVGELLNKESYQYNAQRCFEIGNDLFSFENIGKIKELLQ